MGQHWIPSKKSRYYVPRETFLTVMHYCRQYPLWMAELNTGASTVRAIRYDMDKVQASGNSDPTFAAAVRRAAIERKKTQIDETAKEVADGMADWLIQGVCYGRTYYQLREKGIPCGKNMYYKWRRKFYYMMAQKI